MGYRGFTPLFDTVDNFDYDNRTDQVQQNGSMYNFATGKGGVLYKPEFFHKTEQLIFDEDIYLETCDKQDDVWFYIVRILNGVECYVGDKEWLETDLTQESSLFIQYNMIDDANTVSFRKTIEKLRELGYQIS